MRAQEKAPKEKGTRSPRRLRRCPAFLTSPGARITRQTFAGLPQTGCAPFPRTGCGTRRGLRDRDAPPLPRWRSRASQGKPGQARPCLSASSDSEIASWASAGFYREAQDTRVSGQASGPPFFWVLFFGSAKKIPRPRGRNLVRVCRSDQIPVRNSTMVITPMSDYGALHLIRPTQHAGAPPTSG